MKPKSSPDHAVLAEPWTYTLEELRYAAPEDYADSFIELTLRKGEDLRRLRFSKPQSIEVDAGFDARSYLGLQILDVSTNQMDGVTVEVSCFEGTPGMHFYARDVCLVE